MKERKISVLLVEDDEDDYTLVRDVLSEVPHVDYSIEWASSYEQGLKAIETPAHDVCLLDYRLGERNGIDFLYEAMGRGYRVPIVFLTGQGNLEIDMEAMKAGAADYLAKGEINGPLLDRSIRYAIERKRCEEALLKSHAELVKANEELQKSERELRYLSSQLLTAREQERKRVSQELHDNVWQTLNAIKLDIDHTFSSGDSGPAAIRSGAKRITSAIRDAVERIRTIHGELWPPVLEDFGILAAITWYCREFQNNYSSVSIKNHFDLAEGDVPQSVKIVVYRIMQEALSNVAKHSQATDASLSLTKKDDRIEFSVADNGIGFDLGSLSFETKPWSGLGLLSIQKQTEHSDGSFSIKSDKGTGTVIRASWPMKNSVPGDG